MVDGRPLIGVLAVQGDFEAHRRVLERLGAEVREIRSPEALDGLDGLVLPGGESTTITLGLERDGLAGPLRNLVAAGTPTLGTCAGLIVLDRDHLGVLDLVAERNAFGRQAASFEADVRLEGLGATVHGAFIRAPWVAEHGAGVEVLAEIGGRPVAVRQGNVLAVAFHPELGDDVTLHRWLIERVREARKENGSERPAR